MEFEQALTMVRSGLPCPDSAGIGTLTEKTVHAVLKWWLDDDPRHHEVTLPCGSVADLYDGTVVTEIQTAGFSALRPKLMRLLAAGYPVTVVHPLVRYKQIVWIRPDTGEMTPPRRSPRVGSFTDAGRELIYLLPCLHEPGLTIRLVLLDVEEHRVADGWGRDGKRGSHRAERYPLALAGSLFLRSPADYAVLLPETLGETFTAAAFGRAAHMQGRCLQGTLKVLLETEILTRRKEPGQRGFVYFRFNRPASDSMPDKGKAKG